MLQQQGGNARIVSLRQIQTGASQLPTCDSSVDGPRTDESGNVAGAYRIYMIHASLYQKSASQKLAPNCMSNRTSVSISRGGLFTLATFHFQYFVFFVVIYRKKQDIHKATKTEEIGFANWANCPVTELWTAQLGAPNTCFRALLFLSQRYANVFVTIVSIRTRSTRVVYAGIIFDTKSLITVVE